MSHSLREISFFLSHSNTYANGILCDREIVAYVKCWKWFVSFIHMQSYTFSHIFEMPHIMMTMENDEAQQKRWKSFDEISSIGYHLQYVNHPRKINAERKKRHPITLARFMSWSAIVDFVFILCMKIVECFFNVTLNHVE